MNLQNFFVRSEVIMEYQQPYMQYDPRDVQQTKSIAWLSYLGILFLIPMFVYKESPYTKFHVNQGIVLCILDVAGGVVLGIVSAILWWVPFIGGIISGLLSLAFGVLVLVLMILGIINAATGKAEPLPIIGKIVIYK